MNRKKAQEHLERVAGLRVQCPNRAQDKPHLWHEGTGALSVMSGLQGPYRLTSAFSPPFVGGWVSWHIIRELRLSEALMDAAVAHPLYPKGAICESQ